MRSPALVIFGALLITACASTPPPPPAGQVFATHCASCHGRFGEGDGPMVSVIRVNVPNLRLLSERNNGVFPADSVAAYIDGRNLPAAHGDRMMPVWGDVFDTTTRVVPEAAEPELRIAAIVEYLREMQYD